jgi:TPR repeat protein
MAPLAEAGDAYAQYILGVIYSNGIGVKQDYVEAVIWYRRAAKAGNVDAQYNLGMMYSNEYGVEQNYVEAFTWYRYAAETGDAKSQFNLGVMYLNGQGVPQDYVIAYMWFNLAAAQENKISANGKEIIIKRMTQAQIAEGQRLSRVCFNQNYKNCAR